MTTIDSSDDPPGFTKPGKGKGIDRTFKGLVFGAGMLVLAILLAMLVTTTAKAWPTLSGTGLDFVLSDRWAANKDIFGALAFVYGTIVSSTIALIIAVPVSVGIALFLTELAPRWLRTTAVTIMDLLATIPSVVFGLVGILIIAPNILPIYQGIHSVFKNVPVLGSLFGEATSGRTIFTAGLILAVMIIPIITSISREVFDTVPASDKQAAYALGATRWEMIKGAVFPHSFAGLVGGSMLGLGRAMGETIAVSLVIGSSTQITANLFDSGNSMASVIAQQWGEAGPTHASALISIGVLLFVMTIIVNFAARAVVRRAEARMKGSVS